MLVIVQCFSVTIQSSKSRLRHLLCFRWSKKVLPKHFQSERFPRKGSLPSARHLPIYKSHLVDVICLAVNWSPINLSFPFVTPQFLSITVPDQSPLIYNMSSPPGIADHSLDLYCLRSYIYAIITFMSILIRVLPQVLHICYNYIHVYNYTCTALGPTQVLFFFTLISFLLIRIISRYITINGILSFAPSCCTYTWGMKVMSFC